VDWFAWLEGATSFAYRDSAGRFTARKEQRQRGGWYWKAYRKLAGKLYRVYLGKTADLTAARLVGAATTLAELAEPEPGAIPYFADGEARRMMPTQRRLAAARLPSFGEQLGSFVALRRLATEFPPFVSTAPASEGIARLFHPLLATKLTPPPSRAELIVRPRLIDQLHRGIEHQLTLVVAPPGFGKTTLLSAWLDTRTEGRGLRAERQHDPLNPQSSVLSTQVAWLMLDEADNDPVRFWSYFIAALEQQRPGIGVDATAYLQTLQLASIDTMLTVLINAIAATPGSLVLVLDDYHLITAMPIQQALATLISYLPPNFHLVIASRVDVPLPLARLRARGQVAEIRATDLRCTPDEAAAFLHTLLGRELAPDAIATLLERTEGWMAGLQLAALSLQGHADAAGWIATIRGENRYIWDYLVSEVLEHQPAEVQLFLFHTAFLDRMCAELCDAVIENTTLSTEIDFNQRADAAFQFSMLNAQFMLEHLEAANLFVIPLDTERRWYRYHRLFADVLRLRMRQLHPDLVQPIHRRAAAWYRRSGLTADAIQHALAAQDWEVAAASVEESAEALLIHGEVATLMGWIRMLPPIALNRQPRLHLFYAAALTVVGQFDEAEAQVRAAEQATVESQSVVAATPNASAPFPGELATIKSIVAAGRDDFLSAIAWARTALAQLPQERIFWRLAATLGLSTAHWTRGELEQLIQSTEQQLALSAATGNDLLYAAASLQIAYIQMMQGKLRLAAQTCWRLFEPTAEQRGALSPFVGWATIWLSDIFYEWNDLDAAVRFARDGMAQSQRVGNAEQQASNVAALAHALQAQGDTTGAQAAMDQAIQLAQPLTQVAERALIAAAQARLWLAQGNLAAVAIWAQADMLALDDTQNFVHVRIIEQLTLARLYLAQGGAQAAQAAPLLETLRRDTEARTQYGLMIEAQTLLALAYAATGDSIRARDCLSVVLTLTAPEGHIRLFADLGAPMQALIAACRAQIVSRTHYERSIHADTLLAYIDKVLAAFDERLEARG
jgi:LuxR family maltose regulon positive regulatory protein